MLMFNKISWWLWLATVIFLTAGVFGWTPGFYIAILLAVFQLIYFAITEKSFSAFPVQIRIAFLLVILILLWEPLRFLYWIPVAGIWVLVLTGYCLMARILSLMPWNRKEPLSASLIKRTFLAPPVRGNILQGLPREDTSRGQA
jgi:hypothetical protein